MHAAMTRREFVAGVGLLAASFTIGPERALGAAGNACVWGIATTPPATSTAQLERLIGRRYAGFRRNSGLEFPFPVRPEEEQYDAGRRFIFRNIIAATLEGGRKQPVRWDAIARGAWDKYWRAGARAVMANHRWSPANPYNLSFHHEQAVDEPWQPGAGSCGTPAAYRAAFARIRDVLAAEGALASQGGKIRLCYVPHYTQFVAGQQPGWTASELDPGPHNYDVLGVDLYNRRTSGGLRWGTDAGELLGPVHEFAARAGKRFIVPEVQCGDGRSQRAHAEKADWIASLCRHVKSYGGAGAGSCLALIWTNTRQSQQGDWSVDSSPEALAAHRSWALEPFFERRV